MGAGPKRKIGFQVSRGYFCVPIHCIAQPHFCVFPKPESGFPLSHVMVFYFVFNDFRLLFVLLIFVELLTITINCLFMEKHTERSPSYSQSMKNVGINLNNYPFPSDRGEGEGAGIIRDTLSLSAHHNIFSWNYLKNYYQIQIIFCRKNDPGKTSNKLKM